MENVFHITKEYLMSLADHTLKGMEQYGAIELKRNAHLFVARGFFATLMLTSSLIVAYYTLWPDTYDVRIGPVIRGLAIIAPPPSIKTEVAIAAGFVAPSIDAVKPVFGIPVPVPNAVAPNMYLPDLNLPVVSPGTVSDGGVAGSPPVITVPVKNDPVPLAIEDDPDIFKAVDRHPEAIIDISSLVVYPEVAKRSGLEGKVIISAYIDTDGSVIKTRIDMADYEVFKQPAIDAVTKAKFTPALQGDEAVRLWVTIPISFKLTQR